MVGMIKEGKRIADSGRNFADSIVDSFADLFKSRENAANAVVRRAGVRDVERATARVAAEKVATIRASGAASVVESTGFIKGLKDVFKGTFRFGAWLVEVPVTLFVMKPVKWALNGGTAFFTKFPRLAPMLAMGAAAATAGSWLAKQNSNNLQAQGEAMQQMQAAQAMASPQQAPVSYMNSASQADVEKAMAEGREGQGAAVSKISPEAIRAQVPAPGAAAAPEL